MIVVVGLAAAVAVVALVVAGVLAFRRHRQTTELQEHFHAAYGEAERWRSLGDDDRPDQ